ncbi:MAG: addiction module protein [Planctomycetes bacterium]|nr:addiction module protein [Planctomycetota bacterium]
MNTQQLLTTALALPNEDRATLAQALLRSLDGPSDADAQEAWLVEIEKRAREVEDGSVDNVDWSAARERIAERLREHRK